MGGRCQARFPPADRQVWFRAGPEGFAPSDSFVPTRPGPKRGSGSGRRWGHGLGASVHLEGPRAPNTFPRPGPRAAPALADVSGLVSPQDWPGRASAAAPCRGQKGLPGLHSGAPILGSTAGSADPSQDGKQNQGGNAGTQRHLLAVQPLGRVAGPGAGASAHMAGRRARLGQETARSARNPPESSVRRKLFE